MKPLQLVVLASMEREVCCQMRPPRRKKDRAGPLLVRKNGSRAENGFIDWLATALTQSR